MNMGKVLLIESQGPGFKPNLDLGHRADYFHGFVSLSLKGLICKIGQLPSPPRVLPEEFSEILCVKNQCY